MRLVTAENLTHSNWTVNISEGDLPSPPRVAGDQPEIAAVGKTVHILGWPTTLNSERRRCFSTAERGTMARLGIRG